MPEPLLTASRSNLTREMSHATAEEPLAERQGDLFQMVLVVLAESGLSALGHSQHAVRGGHRMPGRREPTRVEGTVSLRACLL